MHFIRPQGVATAINCLLNATFPLQIGCSPFQEHIIISYHSLPALPRTCHMIPRGVLSLFVQVQLSGGSGGGGGWTDGQRDDSSNKVLYLYVGDNGHIHLIFSKCRNSDISCCHGNKSCYCYGTPLWRRWLFCIYSLYAHRGCNTTLCHIRAKLCCFCSQPHT